MLFDECPATERSPVSYVVPPSDPVPVTVVNPEPPPAAVKHALIDLIVGLSGVKNAAKAHKLWLDLEGLTNRELDSIAQTLS